MTEELFSLTLTKDELRLCLLSLRIGLDFMTLAIKTEQETFDSLAEKLKLMVTLHSSNQEARQ